jgi:hypothetical protein
MLWARHDAVLAHPLGVRNAVGLLCHRALLPLAAGDLNNHHPGGEGVSLHGISVIHPSKRVVLCAALRAAQAKAMKREGRACCPPLLMPTDCSWNQRHDR